MANPNGRKGTQWERDNCTFLSRFWPDIDRKSKEGAKDKGDLDHPRGWAVELKNCSPITIPQYLREAESEAENKSVRLFIALVKNRRGKSESGRVEDGYAITRTRIWAEVARQHEIGSDLLAYLVALNARDLPDSSYRVLANEAVMSASQEFENARWGENA